MVPFPQDDGTLTPYTFELGYGLMTLVYDTLLWRDSSGTPQPWLARSVVTSRDGRRVTIRIRAGARWHDGRRVTARDVAFTFRRFRARFHPRFTPQLEAVRRVRAADDSTVRIELRHPSLGFRDQPLADMPILPRHIWRRLAPGRLAPPGLPVGSGPYRLVEHERGSGYRFRADPGYFRGAPVVPVVEVRVIRSAQETFEAFRRSTVDVIPFSVPPHEPQELDDIDVKLLRGPSYTGTELVFNVRRPPFDDADARRAVASAIDLEQVVRGVNRAGSGTTAIPARSGPLHPEGPWTPPATPAPAPRATGARPGPITILAADNDPVRRAAGREVVRLLVAAGLQAQLDLVPPRALAQALGQDAAAPDFEAAVRAIPALASHDPDFLRVLFGAGMPLNHSGLRSTAFESAAAQVASSRTRGQRERAIERELRVLRAELPSLPLFFQEGLFAYRRGAHSGWVFVKGSGILDKQSFLRGGRPAAVRMVPQPAAAARDGGFGIAGWSALAVGGVAVTIAVAAVASVRRRR